MEANSRKRVMTTDWKGIGTKAVGIFAVAAAIYGAWYGARWYQNRPPPPPSGDVVLYHADEPFFMGAMGTYKNNGDNVGGVASYTRHADPRFDSPELHLFTYGNAWHVTNTSRAVLMKGEGDTEFPAYLSSRRGGKTPAGQKYTANGRKSGVRSTVAGSPVANAELKNAERVWTERETSVKTLEVFELEHESGHQPMPILAFFERDAAKSATRGGPVFKKLPTRESDGRILDAYPESQFAELYIWRFRANAGEVAGMWAIGSVKGLEFDGLAGAPVVGIGTSASPTPIGTTWRFGNGTHFNTERLITVVEAHAKLAAKRPADAGLNAQDAAAAQEKAAEEAKAAEAAAAGEEDLSDSELEALIGELVLCTVTFCANPANDLTCSPSCIII